MNGYMPHTPYYKSDKDVVGGLARQDGQHSINITRHNFSSCNAGSNQADGGDALFMTEPLTLCGRSDADPSRAFNGSLAHLMVFDVALTARDIQVSSAMHG
jgi:hypothetical protein